MARNTGRSSDSPNPRPVEENEEGIRDTSEDVRSLSDEDDDDEFEETEDLDAEEDDDEVNG
jgi:hypothetical protein